MMVVLLLLLLVLHLGPVVGDAPTRIVALMQCHRFQRKS
jgi:hypothetical protein